MLSGKERDHTVPVLQSFDIAKRGNLGSAKCGDHLGIFAILLNELRGGGKGG